MNERLKGRLDALSRRVADTAAAHGWTQAMPSWPVLKAVDPALCDELDEILREVERSQDVEVLDVLARLGLPGKAAGE